ncbi:MAG: dephospho-CoA kinase [Clostridia bacterium]|nr:dephospho-CoA kinase [Clostridia bacterium]
MLIGLMGKSGSGKSLVSRLFKEIDETIQVIDVDKIGHDSHNDPKVRSKLIRYFGDAIFNNDGTVNRKALASIVFNDDAKMQLLYDATYSYMVERIDLALQNAEITILDYALLPLTKYYELCDVNILVEATKDVRSNRVVRRDNISYEKYDQRDANSLDYSQYTFDYTILNNADIEMLRKVVDGIYEKSIVSR